MMSIVYLMDLTNRLGDLQVDHCIANLTSKSNDRYLIIKGANCTYRINMTNDHIKQIQLLDSPYLEALDSILCDNAGADCVMYKGDNSLNSLDELFCIF